MKKIIDMKRILKISLIIIALMSFVNTDTYACTNCPPPPPPGHGTQAGTSGAEKPSGGCAPIDGGLTFLLLMGMAYGGYKTKKLVLDNKQ